MRSAIRSSNRQASPTRRTSASRATGFCEAKMAASTLSIHSRQRAAAGNSMSSTSRLSSPLRWRRRAAAVIGRTAGTSAARKIRARRRARRAGRTGGGGGGEPVEQAAGGAAGHRRLAGRFGGGDAILGQQQIDDFGRRFGPQFGRDGDESVGAAGEVSGEVEGGDGGEGDRPGRGVCPSGVAGSWPPSPS